MLITAEYPPQQSEESQIRIYQQNTEFTDHITIQRKCFSPDFTKLRDLTQDLISSLNLSTSMPKP